MGTQRQSVKSSHLRIACSCDDLCPCSEPMDEHGSRSSRWVPETPDCTRTFVLSMVDRSLQREYPCLRDGCLDVLSKGQEGADGSSKCDAVACSETFAGVMLHVVEAFTPSWFPLLVWRYCVGVVLNGVSLDLRSDGPTAFCSVFVCTLKLVSLLAMWRRVMFASALIHLRVDEITHILAAGLVTLRRFPTSGTDATAVLGDLGTAPLQPVVLPPYGSSLESGRPCWASLKSGRTLGSR